MLGKWTRQEKNDTQDATSLHEANSDNENAFVTRATHSTVPFAPPSNDYLLPSANWITPELREKWGIKYEDFFTIFYKGADERDNAVQHRNQV